MQPATETRTAPHLFLRFMAVLSLTMALCVGAASAAPLVPGVEPAEQTPALFAAAPLGERPALAAEMPKITMQLSAVKAKDGSLDQTMELALLLDLPAGESFSALNVALNFDAAKIKPITFRCQADAAGLFTPDIALGAKAVHVPALMNENLTEAAAYADAAGNLLFRAAAYAPTDFALKPEDGRVVTLAVIRFAAVPAAAGTKPLTLDAGNNTPLYNNAAITGFVKFQDDAAAASSDVHAALSYEYAAGGSKTRLYHVPAYDPNVAGTHGIIPVPGLPETKIDAPNTAGMRVLSATTATPAEYSYLTNHLSKDKVAFSVSVGETFNGKLDPNEFCAVSFRDWSGEELGTLIVPMYQDVRGQVSEHVKANWIHPDLRGVTDHKNMTRANTYRGKYPASGPSGADTVTDGEKYPLTNKLDYAFISQPVRKNGLDLSWVFNEENVVENSYPYAYGWLIAAPGHETTQPLWSTFGVGELAGYSPKSSSPKHDARISIVKDKSDYFTFADFKDLRVRQLRAYAGYLPGEKLATGSNYTAVGEPVTLYHTRYGYESSVGSGTYVTRYQYARINKAGYGVSRPRSIALNANFVPDVSGKPQPPFPQKVIVENKDIVDVEIVQSGTIMSLVYNLVDEYGRNFVSGTAYSSSGNEANIPTNFNYKDFTYSSRLGTDGLVFRATWNAVQEAGNQALLGENAEFNQALSKFETINDLNIRKDAGGGLYDDVNAFKPVYLAVLGLADDANGLPKGNGTLTWHQLQYYILHPADGLLTDAAAKQKEKYGWCRLLDGCATGESIETWDQLIAAAATGDIAKLDTFTLPQATDTFHLRQNLNGDPYTDLVTLKNLLISAVTTATDQRPAALTWDQIQYYLIHAGDPTPPKLPTSAAATESSASYWWKNGGKKVTDWNSLIAAAKTAQGGIHAPLNTIAHTALGGAPYYLRKNSAGAPFATQAEMIAALKAAVDAGTNTWEEVQQRICNDSTTAATYWWGYGGVNLAASEVGKEVADLITAARLANESHPASLNTLTLNMVSGAPYYFRETFAAGQFADLAAAKTKIQAAVKTAGTWEQFQFYFAHNGAAETGSSTGVNDALNGFYWWENGGSPAPTVINASFVNTLMEAAFRAKYNGNTVAWDNLTDINTILKLYLAKARDDTVMEFTEMTPQFAQADLDGLKLEFEALVQAYVNAGNSAYALPELSWFSVQHWLLAKAYVATDPALPQKTYWWEGGGFNPNFNPLNDMLVGMLAWAKGNTSDPNYSYLNKVNVAMMNKLALKKTAFGGGWGGLDANKVKNRLKALAVYAYGSGAVAPGNPYYNGTKLLLDWYQIQYFLIGMPVDLSGYTRETAIATYTWAPNWAKTP